MDSLEAILVPRRAALLVYDMQVGVVRQLKDGEAVVGKVARLLDAARSAGLPVFFTRHVSLPKRLMGRFAVRQAMQWQRKDDPALVEPWFLPNAGATQIVAELRPREDEAVIDKITMSAFEGTYLGIAMRDLGLDALIVVGIATEIGIEPTIRQASDLGIVSILVEDACGAGHAEAGERAIASIRFMGDAIVTELDAVLPLLSNNVEGA